MDRLLLLSFDVEEFDLPTEYGRAVDEATQLAVSAQGLTALLDLLDRLDVTATLFTTAHFATHQPDLIRRAAARHEIASHGYHHSRFEEADLLRSRQALEALTGQSVIGFRMARLAPIAPPALLAAGYRYNSSENPTWIPGRYNHLRDPRTAYFAGDLLNLPVSVTPRLRLPLFWLSFKNFPFWFYRRAALRTLRHDGYLNLYFHPWEFTDLRPYGLPRFLRRVDGPALLARLERLLTALHPHGRFATFREFAERCRMPA